MCEVPHLIFYTSQNFRTFSTTILDGVVVTCFSSRLHPLPLLRKFLSCFFQDSATFKNPYLSISYVLQIRKYISYIICTLYKTVVWLNLNLRIWHRVTKRVYNFDTNQIIWAATALREIKISLPIQISFLDELLSWDHQDDHMKFQHKWQFC